MVFLFYAFLLFSFVFFVHQIDLRFNVVLKKNIVINLFVESNLLWGPQGDDDPSRERDFYHKKGSNGFTLLHKSNNYNIISIKNNLMKK